MFAQIDFLENMLIIKYYEQVQKYQNRTITILLGKDYKSESNKENEESMWWN